jgi:hypothetical protein
MSEKEKGKANPFAVFLRPTEDLLWIDHPRPYVSKSFSTWTNIIYIVVFTVGILLALALRIGGIKSVKDVLSIIALVLVVLGIRRFVSVFSGGMPRLSSLPDYNTDLDLMPTTATYAITSERLLYQSADEVRILPLENLTLVKVLLEDKKRGALSFSPSFPQWSNLDDAKHVKTIIEQARKEHLKGEQL